MKRVSYFSLCVVIVAACTPSPVSTPPASQAPVRQAPTQQPTASAAAPAQATQGKTTLARVSVVDMEGKPLANMMPIAAKQPNAFEKPIAQGALTGADGKGTVVIPQDQWLFVRAWDPTRRVFANNYYDVLPTNAAETQEMVITMVPGASLTMELVTPAGEPVAEENVGIMMFHPSRGPWWPDEGDTDKNGRVTFPSLPPGQYMIKMKTAGGQQIDLPDVALPPNGKTDLGVVGVK